MGAQRSVDEIVVQLNPGGAAVWQARVDALQVVVTGSSPAEAEAAAIVAAIEAGAQLSDDLVVRVRFGTRAQRVAAGYLPGVTTGGPHH